MKRMKQLWLLLFLLAGNVLYAQTQKITTEEQFNAFINEQSAQLMAAYEQETYAKGSDICRAVMTQVETLPAGLKEKYGWQKYNFVFHLTLCLCLQNKKEEALEAFKIAYNNGKDGVLYSAVKGYEAILKMYSFASLYVIVFLSGSNTLNATLLLYLCSLIKKSSGTVGHSPPTKLPLNSSISSHAYFMPSILTL